MNYGKHNDLDMTTLNGYVKPPIVLYSKNEECIAQRAHNLVWEKYRVEWDACDEVEHAELRIKVKPEIDALIVAEINAYRARNQNGCALQARVEQLEAEIEELRATIEEAQGAAEEAQSMAEEAQALAQEAMDATNDSENE